MMWSDATGYWGIGKNTTGTELVSTRNGTIWKPGEVLLHPKGKTGESTSGLVIVWTAPKRMTVEAAFSFDLAAIQSSGIGYRIVQRGAHGDRPIVAIKNIGTGVRHKLTGISIEMENSCSFASTPPASPAETSSRRTFKSTASRWELNP